MIHSLWCLENAEKQNGRFKISDRFLGPARWLVRGALKETKSLWRQSSKAIFPHLNEQRLMMMGAEVCVPGHGSASSSSARPPCCRELMSEFECQAARPGI
jgi:hypothetical protein